MEREELSRLLQESGIAGAGGAGFPAYAKLDQRAETIILNCAECEPLLKLHRQLLGKKAYEILQAFSVIGEAVGAKELIIGIKKSYHAAIEAVNAYIGQYPHMRIGLLDEVYPAGDEVILIYEVTGKVVNPGGLPIESGIAVFNVETVYNVWQAIYAGRPVTEKLVSVVGEVVKPVTLRVPIGSTVQMVVDAAGGAKIKDSVYFSGGPMMGRVVAGTEPITKTTNAILVLPENHPVIQKSRSNIRIDLKRAAASCCQCRMCTDLCPRHLLGHPIEPHRFMQAAACKDVQKKDVFLNTMYCSSCGLCEMYSCMQGLSPRRLITEYKNGLKQAGVRVQKVDSGAVYPDRNLRKASMERLQARLGLTSYQKEAPLQEQLILAARVQILLSQHIGAPAKCLVQVGDFVKKGQMIGAPAKGLSLAVHASLSGKVIAATAEYVIIDATGKGVTEDE